MVYKRFSTLFSRAGLAFQRIQHIRLVRAQPTFTSWISQATVKYGGGLTFASVALSFELPYCSKCNHLKSEMNGYCDDCGEYTSDKSLNSAVVSSKIIRSDSYSYAETRDVGFREKYNPTNIGGNRAAHGIAIEGAFVESFNQDAISKGAPVRAYQVPSEKGKVGTPDIEIRRLSDDKVLKKYQSKNYKNAKACERAFNDPSKGYKEKGQIPITNKENAAKGVGKSKMACKVGPSIGEAAAIGATYGAVGSVVDGVLNGDEPEAIVGNVAVGAAVSGAVGAASSLCDIDPSGALIMVNAAVSTGMALSHADGTREGDVKVARGLAKTATTTGSVIGCGMLGSFVTGLTFWSGPLAAGAGAAAFAACNKGVTTVANHAVDEIIR